MSASNNNAVDQSQATIIWDDKETIVTHIQGTKVNRFSYANLEWESCYLKHKPGPLTEVLREYQKRKINKELGEIR